MHACAHTIELDHTCLHVLPTPTVYALGNVWSAVWQRLSWDSTTPTPPSCRKRLRLLEEGMRPLSVETRMGEMPLFFVLCVCGGDDEGVCVHVCVCIECG
jgi:hypothetical protein